MAPLLRPDHRKDLTFSASPALKYPCNEAMRKTNSQLKTTAADRRIRFRCSENRTWETLRVTAIVRFFGMSRTFMAELTDGAAGHGGEDPQGGRGPTFSYQGICFSVILPKSGIPLQLPSSPRLMSITGQVMDTV